MPLKKINSDRLERLVENYDDVRQELLASKYSHFLDD
jgi:hypothetical protein